MVLRTRVPRIARLFLEGRPKMGNRLARVASRNGIPGRLAEPALRLAWVLRVLVMRCDPFRRQVFRRAVTFEDFGRLAVKPALFGLRNEALGNPLETVVGETVACVSLSSAAARTSPVR
jgi:hypothetical protein